MAQTPSNNNAHSFSMSGTVGIVVDIGLKINRLGIYTSGNLLWARSSSNNNIDMQLNVENRAYYCFNSFGPPKKRWEWQPAAGMVVCWGKKDSTLNDWFYGVAQNRTYRPFAIGYAYRIYADNINMGQYSGALSFQYKYWRLMVENDILAGKGSDKFRTGALRLTFQRQKWSFGLVNILWTCDHKGAKRVRDNSNYPARYGYYDMSQNPWRAFSMGVLAFQVRYALPTYRQWLTANIGVDDERVRHIVQNKLIHDMPFVPNKWNKSRNPHVPMIAADSTLYLYKPDQRLRPTRLWLQSGIDSGDFY